MAAYARGVALQERRPGEAERAFAAAAEADPAFALALLGRAEALLRLRRPEASEGQLDELERLAAGDVGLRWRIHLLRGAEADRLVEAAPHDPRAWLTRGMIRVQQGELAGADDDLTRSLLLDPEHERRLARQVRAMARLGAGRSQEALDDAEALLVVRTAEVGAWQLRAQALERLGRPEEALRDLERLLLLLGDQEGPGVAELRAQVARLRRQSGDGSRAADAPQ